MAEATLPSKKKSNPGTGAPAGRGKGSGHRNGNGHGGGAADAAASYRGWALFGVVLLGGVVGWRLLGTSYKHDLETICNAEKGSSLQLERESSKLAQWVRDHLGTPEGNSFYAGLGEARVQERATKLQEAADKAGVSPCPLVASYQRIAATSEARADVQHLCSDLSFPKLRTADEDARVAMLQVWTDQSARSPRTKELMATLRQAPPGAARAKVLADAASQYEVYSCANAKSLETPPPPPGSGAPVVRLGRLQVSGGVGDEDMRKALDAANPALLGCYKDGLGRKSDLTGKLAYKLAIDSSGKVARVELAEGSTGIPDVPAEACIEKVIKGLQLPALGTPMGAVVVPLELTHDDK